MTEYRTFRNTDPPQLAEIWRSQGSQRGLMQPMSATVFEQLVLAKPTFDPQGLTVATEAGRPIGFAHAAFGPTSDQSNLSTEKGGVSMLMTRRPDGNPAVASELLARSEQYLRSRGAKTLLAGGVRPLDPFYLGLYGGSQMSGILASDVHGQELFSTHGYQDVGRTLIWHRELSGFRPSVDRKLMQVRRRCCALQAIPDPLPKTWWEACTYGGFDRTRFELRKTPRDAPIASVMFWNMQPLSNSWGVQAAGLVDLQVAPNERRQAVASFLLGEAFRQLAVQNIMLVEAQSPESDATATAFFQKAGFKQVDTATAFCKL